VRVSIIHVHILLLSHKILKDLANAPKQCLHSFGTLNKLS
jgi:hypothetical protein